MDTEADDNSRTIFCANLHKNVTEEILYELFLQAGPVQRVRIPPNNNYGFVTYQHLCSVDYALEVFKDTELYGTPLKLKRRQIRNKDDSNNTSNNNQNSNYNSVLQTGNNFVHNMYSNMMPQNMMQQAFYNNMYQNNDYYSPNTPNKHDRNRSPPRNRHSNNRQDRGTYQMPRGRFENNHHLNKRYDYDDKYDHRSSHNDRRNHKRQKR